MTKLIVLDFSSGEVYVTEFNESSFTAEQHIEEVLELRVKDCEYMFAENLNINFI